MLHHHTASVNSDLRYLQTPSNASVITAQLTSTYNKVIASSASPSMTIQRTISSKIAQLCTKSNRKLPWDSHKHQVQLEQITGRLRVAKTSLQPRFNNLDQKQLIKLSSRPKLQMFCPPPPILCCQLAMNKGDSTSEVLEIGSTKGFTSQRM